MHEREITRADVAGRARVDEIATRDPTRALELAKDIKHPWYRCQALTTAAEHLHGHNQEQILLSALRAAKEQGEINRVVTVASWPIRVLAITFPNVAAKHIEELVALAQDEPHNLRRTHELQSLAFSVANHHALLRLIVPALAESVLGAAVLAWIAAFVAHSNS